MSVGKAARIALVSSSIVSESVSLADDDDDEDESHSSAMLSECV